MGLRLYNTLTREIEDFEPLEPGRVRMYTCGPTVYERAHIGNFRAFAWEDLLRRYLRWKGFEVNQVMNLTDVDDRTISEAVRRGATLSEVTGPVAEAFFEDWETLGLEAVEENPRATEHVPQMIELIRRLEAGGFTYERDGSVYFAIDRLPAYGRLIGLDPEAARAAGRVEGDEEYSKDDPRDFVLWKGGERGDEGGVAAWDSPWGVGRPGWHLECSAMAMAYLGETLDIHTGGVDNIFPHHVNEMAQSEAATGKPFARFWLHAEHLLVDGGKMSKSLGNYHTIPSLLEGGAAPSAIRYLLLSAHYRTRLNFTLAGLEAADRAVERLYGLRERLRPLADAGEPEADAGGAEAIREASGSFARAFEEAMDDDLNASDALAAAFTFVRDLHGILDRGGPAPPPAVRQALDRLEDFDRVFGILSLRSRERRGVETELAAWVEEKLRERARAREAREFDRADAIRTEIEARGIALEDTPDGTRWRVGGRAP
ncbi:MAG: cysteine--tRNA ligase [Gemmatimonadota bacterium]